METVRAGTRALLPSELQPAAALKVVNQADEDELFIYGEISPWEVSAPAVIDALNGSRGRAVRMRINSGGGSVFEGFAIYEALLRHDGRVTASIDGLAASAASFIAMAASRVEIGKPGKMMIHDAAGLTIGNAATHRETAELLDELSDTIAEIYADRTGTDPAVWREAMRAETWYSSAAAVEAGLADEVTGRRDRETATNKTTPAFDWNPGAFLRAVEEAVNAR